MFMVMRRQMIERGLQMSLGRRFARAPYGVVPVCEYLFLDLLPHIVPILQFPVDG